MLFNLEKTNQSVEAAQWLRANLYKQISTHPAVTGQAWRCVIAVPVALANALITVATRIALIVEKLIKGSLNIVGCCLFERCKLLRGCGQIGGAAWNGLCLPLSVLSAVCQLFSTTYKLLKDPENFAYQQWLKNDPVKLKEHQDQLRWRAEEAARKEFQRQRHLNDILGRDDPDYLKSVIFLASAYEKGAVVTPDENLAAKFRHEAADKGHLESMVNIAKRFYEGKGIQRNEDMAYSYYRAAADKGSQEAKDAIEAHFLPYQFYQQKKCADELAPGSPGHLTSINYVAKAYEDGRGVDKDRDEAYAYYKKARDAGCPNADQIIRTRFIFENNLANIKEQNAQFKVLHQDIIIAGDHIREGRFEQASPHFD